jgi:hypothetical protein
LPRERSQPARAHVKDAESFKGLTAVGAAMQSPAGPTGPPVAGPTGPPVAGPSGPPEGLDAAQFDPLAEIEDARARRKDREERLELLQKKRNSARINVYLFLALTVVLAGFSFFPVSYGDVSDNPQERMSPSAAEKWVASGEAEAYDGKIWDGANWSTSTHKNIYIPPPAMPDLGSTSAVRVDVTVVSWRSTGMSYFKAGLFDGDCAGQQPPHEELPADAWYHHTDNFSVGESVEFTLYTQPGQKCLLIVWDEPMESQILATMDVEMSIHWPRMLTVPAAVLTFLLSGFAFIGAQKSGRSFKALKYPEGKPEKRIEKEVLEVAEAEKREQIDAPEVVAEDADTIEVEGPSLSEAAASPVQDDTPIQETSTEQDAAGPYTDEELLGAGWSQAQIDAMRND